MAINVLIVIDGAFLFENNTGTPDFSFAALVSILTGAGFQVTKANREADPSADIPDFNFATSTNLLNFDVIWMIGDGGFNDSGAGQEGTKGPLDTTNKVPNPVPSEKNAIANFMEQGGGVFAVGDHWNLGSDMCGLLPRVRVMRSWFGDYNPADNGNATPPELSTLPGNYPSVGSGRADTTLRNPHGIYPTTDASGNPTVNPYAYFQNQSDPLPQTITPTTTPAHPILQNNGQTVTVYPDHMHEGNALGPVTGFDYVHQLSPYGDTSKPEFRTIAGDHPTPQVVATGQTRAQGTYYVGDDIPPAGMAPMEIMYDTQLSGAPPVNTLSTYDGRSAGLGRIVTGSTFHHYLDINLTGTSYVTDANINTYIGGDAGEGQGLSTNASAFADIKAVYVNITNWLARPKPAISLILERSTFGQAEVGAMPSFANAIYVTVDGLKPSQFPGGGPNSGMPLAQWAPVVSVSGFPIVITPTGYSSDDNPSNDRLQRFTIAYSVNFTGNAFTFPGPADTVPVNASLTTPTVPSPLTDQAWVELVKGANPYMLDLADGNTTSWLSSDIKVFHVVAGDSFLGQTLSNNATRAEALNYLQNVLAGMNTTTFTNLDPSEDGATSVLGVAATTTGNPAKPVYNFALARVRISSAGGDANPVQVFFRTFVTQTTAALTYQLDASMHPTGGYLQTPGNPPIPLPGTQDGGSQWLSFPYFASPRTASPAGQNDPNNSKPVLASAGYQFFGALIDNNLADPYETETPVSGGPNLPLTTLLMGEHQCVVTEVIYGPAPIANGANPATSDKISQRNLAISTIANPGLSASRVAMHTFEIEATPGAITATMPPDELLLSWRTAPPSGTYVTLHIAGWNAQEVVALADRLYARHQLRAIDADTIELPGGGDRYVPIPHSLVRQAGVLAAEFPLGVRKGQRFDLSVQQITNRQRLREAPPPTTERITLEEARKLLDGRSAGGPKSKKAASPPRGVFDLGDGRTLVTDLSIFDGGGDHAVILTPPDPTLVAAAQKDSGSWREPIGSFQLGIPVSTKQEMLPYHLQLLSIMLWRVEHLDRKSPWYPTMTYYLELLIEKVRALRGDPYSVPATPDGNIPQLCGSGRDDGRDDDCRDEDKHDVVVVNIFPRGRDPKK